MSAVSCAYRLHRKELKIYYFKKYVLGLFLKRFRNIEKPLLYSNIKLNVKGGYVLLKKEDLMRETRFNYGSTLLISEASLVADSMNFKDTCVNESLTLFNKLIGHSTRGGHLIYDTQCLFDCHYSIKRVCSQYYYITKTFKWLPFIVLVKCKKMEYNPDIEQVVVDKDAEDTGYWYIINKKTFKRYDRYCYSIFTDNNPVSNEIDNSRSKDLKTKSILQIREFKTLNKNLDKEEKKDEKKVN